MLTALYYQGVQYCQRQKKKKILAFLQHSNFHNGCDQSICKASVKMYEKVFSLIHTHTAVAPVQEVFVEAAVV